MWKGDNWALLAEVGTGLCLNEHVLSCNVSTGARIFGHSCNLYRRMKVKRKLTLCKASRNNHRKIQRASLACNRTLVSCMHYAWSFLLRWRQISSSYSIRCSFDHHNICKFSSWIIIIICKNLKKERQTQKNFKWASKHLIPIPWSL